MKIILITCLLVTCVVAQEIDTDTDVDLDGFESRIVQGSNAALYSHPHQASLQLRQLFGWYHICGAVLIAPDKLLTAAHCLQGQSASRLRIKIGAMNLYEAPNAYEQTIALARYVIHENYNGNAPGVPNDIAVIYLQRPVTLNRNVQIAGLAPKGSSFADSKCVITGWGQTSGTGSGAQHLQEVKITKITTEHCRSKWPSQNVNIKHICVYEVGAAPGTRPSACMGDSGGPMMCGDNFELLAGITSWGVSNCSGDYPSVYTRVSEYLDWIASKTG